MEITIILEGGEAICWIFIGLIGTVKCVDVLWNELKDFIRVIRARNTKHIHLNINVPKE